MHTNKTNGKIIHPELSYQLTGVFFKIHNELGRYCKEKQYGDALEKLLRENSLSFDREKSLSVSAIDNKFTNKADFVVESKIVIEIKVPRGKPRGIGGARFARAVSQQSCEVLTCVSSSHHKSTSCFINKTTSLGRNVKEYFSIPLLASRNKSKAIYSKGGLLSNAKIFAGR